VTPTNTDEYLRQVCTRDHRILLARLDSVTYLVDRLDAFRLDGEAALVVAVLRAVAGEVAASTSRFVRAYEALDAGARLGPALGLAGDPLAAE
jgi:hypothetical protein